MRYSVEQLTQINNLRVQNYSWIEQTLNLYIRRFIDCHVNKQALCVYKIIRWKLVRLVKILLTDSVTLLCILLILFAEKSKTIVEEFISK